MLRIREAASQVVREASELRDVLDVQKPQVGRPSELSDLRLAAEKIAAHAERQVLLIDTQCALLEAAGLPRERVPESLAGLLPRWSTHRERMQQVLEQSQPLYSRGDPLGLAGLLADITSIESHLKTLTSPGDYASAAPLQVLLDERFEQLDASRWIVLGTPQVVNGNLETRALAAGNIIQVLPHARNLNCMKHSRWWWSIRLRRLRQASIVSCWDRPTNREPPRIGFRFTCPRHALVSTRRVLPSLLVPGRISSQAGNRECTVRRSRRRPRIVCGPS